jgi:serine/threonine protein kinase
LRALTFNSTIGSGAFGTVYLAEMETGRDFQRQVAVKVILKDHAEKEMFLSRMRDEARLLGLLQDDHVLKVIDLLNMGGRDAIVMEYIEGIDLSFAIEQQQRPPMRAILEIGAIVAGTLGRAHQAKHPISGEHLGVVHRDVKPANVMITSTGGLKLLDFGIAQARFDARESQTGQMVLGTLNYMAPDYIITGEVTPALDVYGLGLTLFELLEGSVFGQPKLREDQHNVRLKKRLAPMRDAHPKIADLLGLLLHWDPDQRPGASDCEHTLLSLSDEAGGLSLRRYAATIVPKLIRSRPKAIDQEQLLGKTIQLGANNMDSKGESTLPEKPTHPPEPSQPLDTSPDATDTTIDDPVRVSQRLEPHTGEVAAALSPTRLPEQIASRSPVTARSVTLEEETLPTSMPRAILTGILIGSSVGVLAVSVLAIVLFI